MSQPDPSLDRPYFFDQGLRFECTGCGKCCSGESGTIFVNDREAGEIAERLGIPVDQFLRDFAYPVEGGHSIRELDNGDCVFLNGNLCGIYDVRPTQCRTYPFWPEIMRSESGWQHAARACEGIGRGRVHSRDEIMAQINRTLEECADAKWSPRQR